MIKRFCINQRVNASGKDKTHKELQNTRQKMMEFEAPVRNIILHQSVHIASSANNQTTRLKKMDKKTKEKIQSLGQYYVLTTNLMFIRVHITNREYIPQAKNQLPIN